MNVQHVNLIRQARDVARRAAELADFLAGQQTLPQTLREDVGEALASMVADMDDCESVLAEAGPLVG